MTTQTTTPAPTPCAADAFYDLPSPAKAVRLAIADAKADGNGTPEFFHHLNTAARQLETFPALLAALEALNIDSGRDRKGTADYDITVSAAALNQARAALALARA